MGVSRLWTEWDASHAREWIAVPSSDDDKYSRGVLGIVTGSAQFPGAAVLGVEGAARTGVGMIRYHGPAASTGLVMQRRPEVVTVTGRVQAWLIGSGMSANERDRSTVNTMKEVLGQRIPTVVDAGALDLIEPGASHIVATPHYRELCRLLAFHNIETTPAVVADDPGHWAALASAAVNVTVLLKGSPTHIATPMGGRFVVPGAPTWLATAGSGDILGGILGALLATHSGEVEANHELLGVLAATASYLHGAAAERASVGGPIVALDIAVALRSTIAGLLSEVC
jgi:NAD(P)H-hydrate repair Nnr-like enzyme with NAD(P)H-hydrate dehydratase domain